MNLFYLPRDPASGSRSGFNADAIAWWQEDMDGTVEIHMMGTATVKLGGSEAKAFIRVMQSTADEDL